MITLDALFFLVHVALDRAWANVDAYVLAPLAATMLHRIDVRLAADAMGARPDVAESFSIARSLVAVALTLAESTYEAPPAIGRCVMEERELVLAHAGTRESPCLGVLVDYSAMTPNAAFDRGDGLAGWFLSVAWLQHAALALTGIGERDARGDADVAVARTHARAALLLSRAVDPDVDNEAASAWERIERLGQRTIGDRVGATPRDVREACARAALDVSSIVWLASTG